MEKEFNEETIIVKKRTNKLAITGFICMALMIFCILWEMFYEPVYYPQDIYYNEREIFNNGFLSYEGDKVTGSHVNSLIQKVIASNKSEYSGNYVAIQFPSISGEEVLLYVNDKTGETACAIINDDNEGNAENLLNKIYKVNFDEEQSVVYRVKTGKQYNVEIAYKDEVVKAIYVSEVEEVTENGVY